MKVLNLFKSIHLICFVICVASTTLWSFITFPGISIVGVTLFLSQYCLFGFYQFFLRSPISISASISSTVIVLLGNWLIISPEEARKGGLAAIIVLPPLFWAVGVTIALAGAITQTILKFDIPVTRTVIVFLILVVVLTVAWRYTAFAAQSIDIISLTNILVGCLTLFLVTISRNKP